MTIILQLTPKLVPAAYDVTRRETFESIEDIWMREVDMYSTVDDAVKIVVGNKVDKVRGMSQQPMAGARDKLPSNM